MSPKRIQGPTSEIILGSPDKTSLCRFTLRLSGDKISSSRDLVLESDRPSVH